MEEIIILSCVSYDSNTLTTLSTIGTFLSGISVFILIGYQWHVNRNKELSNQFNELRHKLTRLKRLLANIMISDEKLRVAGLISEVIHELSENVRYDKTYKEVLSFLEPKYAESIEILINTVRENNINVKEQINYSNQIHFIIDDISNTFPIYSLLIDDIFSLLLYYKQTKLSSQQINRLLHDENTKTFLEKNLESNIYLSLKLRLTSFITNHLCKSNIVLSLKEDIILSEDIANILCKMLELLLTRYIILNYTVLNNISIQQNKERYYPCNRYTDFVAHFSNTFSKIQQDFTKQDQDEFIELLDNLQESFIIASRSR